LEEECFKQTVSVGFKPGLFDTSNMGKEMSSIARSIKLASGMNFEINREFKLYGNQLRLGAVKFKLDKVCHGDLLDLLGEKFTNFSSNWNYWASVRLDFFPSPHIARAYLDENLESYNLRYHSMDLNEMNKYNPDYKPSWWQKLWGFKKRI